jgi:hypothetical protein
MSMSDADFRTALSRAAVEPASPEVLDSQGIALVKAGIYNTVSCAAFNFAGRHHVTSNDVRLAEAIWTLMHKHFTSRPDDSETQAVHTPKPAEAPTQILQSIEQALGDDDNARY